MPRPSGGAGFRGWVPVFPGRPGRPIGIGNHPRDGVADRKTGPMGRGQEPGAGERSRVDAGSLRFRLFVPSAPGSRVTRLELFHDLVFVFAFINLATTLSHRVTAGTLLAGALVLALLWRSWSSFANLGNAVRADHGAVPMIGVITMIFAFVLALSIPEAFLDRPGGLPGPAVFAACYLGVRVITTITYWLVPGTAARISWRIWAFLGPGLVTAALIMAAGLVPQTVADGQHATRIRLALWLAALLIEYVAGFTLPYAGLTVISAGHWAERHAQVVLIALGESLVSLGVGAGRSPQVVLTWRVVVTAGLGVVLVAMLWWLYFDTLAGSVEQAVHGIRDARRVPLVRDVYTYLHLPLIGGVIGTGLGLRLLIGVEAAAGRSQPYTVEVAVPYAGVALYLLSTAAIAWRTFGQFRYASIGTAALLAGLAGPVAGLPVLGALGLLTGICVCLTLVYRFGGTADRTRVRESALHEQQAVEAATNRWRRQHL